MTMGGVRIKNCELEEYIRALRRYSLVLTKGNTADADDLVQETLKRALTYLGEDSIRVRDLRRYLFSIVHNAWVDSLMQEKRKGGRLLPENEALHVSVPPQQYDRIAFREAVDAVHALPEKQREVMLLVGVAGVSYKEAAKILNVPIGTIMSRLNRARDFVLQRLGRTENSRKLKRKKQFHSQ